MSHDKKLMKTEEVYTLAVPVELHNRSGEVTDRITELTFKRLKGADARKVLNAKDKGTGEFIAALVCASAGIPPSTFDQLDAADVFKAGEIAADFFGVSQAT
ncbi:MAG TPA: phage tail assembly protein [Roseateles sp.]